MLQSHQFIYLFIITVALIVSIPTWRKNAKHRPVVILLALTLCSETISRVLAFKVHNNNYVYHFFNPIQAIVWGWFFYINLEGRVKKTVVPLLVLLILFGVFNTIYLQGLTVFPANFLRFETVLLLFWSFALFTAFLDRPSREHIFSSSLFVACVAVMWFNLTSFLFFQLFNFYIAQHIPTDAIRNINYFSNYTYYSLLLVAMCLNETPRQL